MQETNITFSGLALTPYSDISPDGQLSACIGLDAHGGSLRPALLVGKQYTPPEDGKEYTLIHVHIVSAQSRFIFRNGDNLYWAEVSEGQYTPKPLGTYTGLSSVNTIENTLVVLASSGLHYLLWKDGNYKYIGQKPPEIGMAFALNVSTYERHSDQGTLTIVPSDPETPWEGQIVISEEEDQRIYLSNVVWEAINKTIEGCTENNLFCMPFFVRAAYRRFDGSYTMLTPPVLMIPDSVGPKAYFTVEKFESSTFIGKVTGRAWAASLLYTLTSNFAEDIQSWSDVISSVDIFVSPQVMRADSSQWVSLLYGPDNTGLPPWNGSLTWAEPPEAYGIGSLDGIPFTFRKYTFDWELESLTRKYFRLGMKEEEAFLQELNGNMQFYKVRSISIGQLSGLSAGEFFPLMERKVDFANLVQLESLPDIADYQSHDSLVSLRSYAYNQRLHLFDVERNLFMGFLPENAWPWTDSGDGGTIDVSVYVAAEDGNVRVVSCSSSGYHISQIGRFLYYPDPRATRMVITGPSFSYDIPLQPHPMLNGAYHIFIDTEPARTDVSQPEDSLAPVRMTNKIYVSEPGNPFRFPAEGIYTVGSGQVLALSTIAVALSQGQFGQFPLMAFCSDGNYALSVNGEGQYSAIHPMQRDVCTNPDSITQTDSEVLFVTSRGVMATSGVSAQSLSEILDGVPERIPQELPFTNPSESPADFFKTCRVIYDYTNRRIIFFSSGKELSYVYSIEEQAWSSASFGGIASVINRFPYSYVQMDGGTIVLLSESYPYNGEPVRGLIYTRPVKMGTLSRKKLFRLSVQGIFCRPQNVLIYASNDGVSWHFLGRSFSHRILGMSGRSFKYYRFAIETDLKPSESISALRIHYEPRAERRFR